MEGEVVLMPVQSVLTVGIIAGNCPCNMAGEDGTGHERRASS